MRAKALEIRWHETNPIFSADFHYLPPHQHKKPIHPYATSKTPISKQIESDRLDREKQWRLATCGGDKNVRLWLVTPRPSPTLVPLTLPTTIPSSSSKPNPQSSTSSTRPGGAGKEKDAGGGENPDPKVEYLATLSQHTGVVNCVRFCPNGETLASAGDDGNILLWVPGEGTKKIGETEEDRLYERESWRVKSMIRSMTGKEIYDLAWSPSGQQILAGSVDHTATIYDVSTGQALHRIAEHTNYVQGVAWDPRDEFIATQSSDRSMHVYSIGSTNGSTGGMSVHAVGKNSRMELQRRLSSSSSSSSSTVRSSSQTRGRTNRPGGGGDTAAGDGDGDVFLPPPRLPNRARSTSRTSENSDRSESSSTSTRPNTATGGTGGGGGENVVVVETAMEPPSSIPTHHPTSTARPGNSRRSSSSTTATSRSPALGPVSSRPLRSPSPAPLPAVMLDLSTSSSSSSTLPPASSSSANPTNTSTSTSTSRQQQHQPLETIKLYSDANSTPFFRRLSWSTDGSLLLTPAGMFEDPFSLPLPSTTSTSTTLKKGKKKEETTQVTGGGGGGTGSGESKPTVYIYTRSNVSKPPVANLMGHRTTSIAIRFCPVLWELRRGNSNENEGASGSGSGGGEDGEPLRIELTDESKEVPLPGSTASTTGGEGGSDSTHPTTTTTRSLFDLPYRMVYAVATLDSVYLYDTQQEAPICMFGNLHYAPFTDLTWAPDGKTLILSSQDGYCSIVAFSPGELGTPYTGPQPHVSTTAPSASSPTKTTEPVQSTSAGGGGERKLDEMFSSRTGQTSTNTSVGSDPSTPATSQPVSSSSASTSTVPGKRPASPTSGVAASGTIDSPHQPLVKKKKKVALTHVGPLGGGGGGAAGGEGEQK
ncbi:hypothetical protein JCM16303_004253 [Sporobolomyces ruberrimus]